jgi:class 3 adenylate cyclase
MDATLRALELSSTDPVADSPFETELRELTIVYLRGNVLLEKMSGLLGNQTDTSRHAATLLPLNGWNWFLRKLLVFAGMAPLEQAFRNYNHRFASEYILLVQAALMLTHNGAHSLSASLFGRPETDPVDWISRWIISTLVAAWCVLLHILTRRPVLCSMKHRDLAMIVTFCLCGAMVPAGHVLLEYTSFTLDYVYWILFCFLTCFRANLLWWCSALVCISLAVAIVATQLSLETEWHTTDVYLRLMVVLFITFSFYLSVAYSTERQRRRLFLVFSRVFQEEKMVCNTMFAMLPRPVMEEIQQLPKSLGQVIVHERAMASVLFTDIVMFTALCTRTPPADVVSILNVVFSTYDSLCQQHNVYKVETIGDAYMACTGVVHVHERSAHDLVECALAFQERIRPFRTPAKEPIKVRIGIHSGDVIAGVVGRKMPRYHLFGQTVTLAEEMEKGGVPAKVVISCATKDALDRGNNNCDYMFEPMETTEATHLSKFVVSRSKPVVSTTASSTHDSLCSRLTTDQRFVGLSGLPAE